jgi:hypothetical protein
MNKKEGLKVAKLCATYVNEKTATSKCTTDEQKNAVRKHFERVKNQEPEKTVQQWITTRLKSNLQEIAHNLPMDGYSMGSIYTVRCNRLSGCYDREHEYANSCKYRAQHGRVDAKISLEEYRNISIIGGLITHIAPNQHTKVKKCWWYAGKGQKSNFVLIRQNGYIFEGYHSLTKSGALEGGLRNIVAKKEKEVAAKKYARALRAQYTYQDSIDAGNCEIGTKAFILRCNLNAAKKYRGAFLLKTAQEKSTSSISYVKRMIEHKAR